MILRALISEWAPFVKELCSRKDVETAGIILAERLNGGEVLIAREMLLVPVGGYEIRRKDQLRIDPIVINRLVRKGRDKGLSILTVHTHPETKEPWFSAADDAGDSRLMPSLFSQMQGPHGSLVIAGETGNAEGRVWLATGQIDRLEIRLVGKTIRTSPIQMNEPAQRDWFNRQQLALGEDGQRILRDLHVAVVGLGGTGSIVCAQLAHLGVGRITAIDGDIVDDTNVSRIIGARSSDAGATNKVDVADRYALGLGIGTQIRALNGRLGQEIATGEIEGCDIVISCVDRHSPRALLNRLAYEKAIPLIDMGSGFRVDPNGRIVAGAGRVVVVGPERPCLACWGHIDPHRLRIEALNPLERIREAADGYIQGIDVPQPSVISFNTMIAGAAVIEFLRVVTHFAGAEDPPLRLSFDFETGTVRRNCLAGSRACRICLSH